MIECVRVTYHMRWLSLASAHSSARAPGFTSCSAATNPDDAPSDKSWGGGGCWRWQKLESVLLLWPPMP